MTIRMKRIAMLAGVLAFAAAFGLWFTVLGTLSIATLFDGSSWSVSTDGPWEVNRLMLLSARANFHEAADVDALNASVGVPSALSARRVPEPVIVLVEGHYANHEEVVQIEGSCEPTVEHRDAYNRKIYSEVVDERACAFSADFDPKTRRYKWLQFKGASSRGDTGDARWHEVRGGAWKVDRALVTTIKNRLQEAAANPASRWGMEPNLPAVSDYFVQVQGQVDNGKRVVELFGACGMGAEEARYLNWQMFVILDGGPCLFSGKFDVESQQFVWFNFNGTA